jgi:hypothetical protein
MGLARWLQLAVGGWVNPAILGFDPHAEAMAGTKRDRRQELECLAGFDRQAILAGDCGQDEHGLHQGEVIADADARAIAEREVSATWQALDQVVIPSLRTEGLGVVEPAGIAVN